MIAALMRPNPGGLPPPLQIDPARPLLETPGAGAFAALGAGHMAELPKRMFEESENLRQTGDYNPAPYVETALSLAGGGAPAAERGALGALGGKLAPAKEWDPGSVGIRMVAKTGKEGAAWNPDVYHPFTETPGSMEILSPSNFEAYEKAGHKVGAYFDRATGQPVLFKENTPLSSKPGTKPVPPRKLAEIGKIGTDQNWPFKGTTLSEYTNKAYENAAIPKSSNVGPSSPWKPLGSYTTGTEYFPESIGYEGVPEHLPTPVPERAAAAGFNVPLAHGTRAKEPFGEFQLPEEGIRNRSEIGVHAGSPKAANYVGGVELAKDRPSRVYPLVMRAQNPLETPDMGNWGPQQISEFLESHPQFGKEEVSYALGGKPARGLYEPDSDKQIQGLRDLIRRKGYDSIKYINKIEDPGHTSYIALDPNQLRSPWAAFKDLESRNLLAGLAGGAVAAPAVASGVQDYVRALNK